jgi:hypothetical protein
MLARILITISALIFGGVVPYLELDATHVFNPHWPSHARLHEVWQLTTNSSIAVFCLWQTWRNDGVRLSALLGLMVTGGFFVALFTQNFYGGSMLHTDGTERMLAGINIAVLGFGLVVTMLVTAFVLRTRALNAAELRAPGPGR